MVSSDESFQGCMLGLALGDARKASLEAARDSACITHAHELGMQGGAMMAAATASALVGGPCCGLERSRCVRRS